MMHSNIKHRRTGPGFTDSLALEQAPHKAAPKRESRRLPPRLRHGHLSVAGRELSTPIVLSAALEILLLSLAGLFAPAFRFAEWSVGIDAQETLLRVVVFAGITFSALLSVGFYRRGLRIGFNDLLLRILGAFALSGIGLGFMHYLNAELVFGRGTLLIAFTLALPLLLLSRLLIVPLLDLNAFARRVLVIGTGDIATSLQRLRRKADQRGFVITGFIRWTVGRIRVAADKVITLEGSLHEYASAHRIDDIVIALDDQRGTLPITDLVHCKMDGIRVLDVADFLERETGLLKLDILRPSSLVFSRSFRQSIYRDAAKRVLDIIAGLGLLLLALPFMALTALGILIESRGRGTVLYKQTRVGENGQTFTLYKFRSMIMDAEKHCGARWAQKNDPRITRFGTFLRKTRLDELPQLYNVLKGDMSFVGPRPERPEFVADLAEKLPYYEWRHWVKPGLTGWAQIHYPYGASEQDAFEKLQYDLYYVKHQSLILDILTIMQTVEVILWRRGSR